MIYLAVLAFGVTLGLPIAVIFASRAQGSATSTALEGIARQPESAPPDPNGNDYRFGTH